MIRGDFAKWIAVGAFLLSLGLIFLLIGADIYQPWTPTIVVLLYSLVLIQLGGRNVVGLSAEVSSSPYYLGFLAALVCIFFAFRRPGIPDQSGTQTAIRTIGSATLTTVVGLACRYSIQILYGDDGHDEYYSRLEAGVKRNVDAFLKGQADLITAVSEFTRHREALLEADRNRTSEYLRALAGFITELKSLQSEHVQAARRSVAELQELNRAVAQTTAGLRESAPNKALDKFRQSAENAGRALQELEPAVSQTYKALRSFHEQATLTETDLRSIDSILSDFILILRSKLEDFASNGGNGVPREKK